MSIMKTNDENRTGQARPPSDFFDMDFLISLKPSGMVPSAILVRQAGIALGSHPLTKASNRLVDFLDCGTKHQHRIPLVNGRDREHQNSQQRLH